MHKTTAKHRKVLSDVTPFKNWDTNKEKLGFVKQCKENRMQCPNVVQLGEIYL